MWAGDGLTPPSLQDVTIWKSCYALPGMEHLPGCPLRGKTDLTGTCPPGVGAACSLDVSPGRFPQICSILPNTIPIPTERKLHCRQWRGEPAKSVGLEGWIHQSTLWLASAAKVQKWFSAPGSRFTSQPGKRFGEKNLNNPVCFSCLLLSITLWCGRGAAHRGKAVLKLLLCCQG